MAAPAAAATFKLVLVGDGGTGKVSLNTCCHNLEINAPKLFDDGCDLTPSSTLGFSCMGFMLTTSTLRPPSSSAT